LAIELLTESDIFYLLYLNKRPPTTRISWLLIHPRHRPTFQPSTDPSLINHCMSLLIGHCVSLALHLLPLALPNSPLHPPTYQVFKIDCSAASSWSTAAAATSARSTSSSPTSDSPRTQPGNNSSSHSHHFTSGRGRRKINFNVSFELLK
jgi:hypothetical protein